MADRTETTNSIDAVETDAPAPERPAFTGLVVYRNPEYRYSFLYPDGWYEFELETDAGQGVIFSPHKESIATSFSVEARDIGMAVGEEDIPDLHAGLIEGIADLHDVTILHDETYFIDPLVGLELRVSYAEGEGRQIRFVRLLYQSTIQIRMVSQGEESDYTYWEPMLNQMLRTFRFGDWWADMMGQSWLPDLNGTWEDDLSADQDAKM